MGFSRDALKIDAEAVATQLTEVIRRQIRRDLRREGAIVGISGGIDSSVVVALCVRALGPERVLGVLMPERESSPDSALLATNLAEQLGIEYRTEDITGAVEAMGCYRTRDEAIRQVFPEFTPEYKSKITIGSNLLEDDSLNYFRVEIESPEGKTQSKRMRLKQYMEVVAASNLKQRTRMMTLYRHADQRNWAVAGTGNKDEHELGFFVKYGDGGADLKPIAHLFKMQVFQLAEYLGIPSDIVGRIPTTDTYSAEVTQTDFFFGVDFDILDPVWLAMERGLPASETAAALGLRTDQVDRIYKDIVRKQRGTDYLRREPLKYDE
jgi:NAD+ synthase